MRNRYTTTGTRQSVLARRYRAAEAAGEDVTPGSIKPDLNSPEAQELRNTAADIERLKEMVPDVDFEDREAHAAGVFDD